MQFGEVPLDFQQQSGQCVGFSLHLVEIVVVEVEYLQEVGQKRLALKDVCILIEALVGFLVLIILVVYLTYTLIQDILER